MVETVTDQRDVAPPGEVAAPVLEGAGFWRRVMPHLWLLSSTTSGLVRLQPQIARLREAVSLLHGELSQTQLHPASQQALRGELSTQKELLEQAIAGLEAARAEVAAALRELA